MSRLSTHVLDAARGQPAAGVPVELFRLHDDGTREKLAETTTNHDGRTDQPLLSGAAFTPGIYELLFHIGAYFRAQNTDPRTALPEPAFLDAVPLRVGIADAGKHYHVPLLCTPWSYSTYRGS
jgi:5-hydroxyisourate hydrolase